MFMFCRTVRVKNLNKDIVEEDLRELFAFYGKIKSVIMIKGKLMYEFRTGSSRL